MVWISSVLYSWTFRWFPVFDSLKYRYGQELKAGASELNLDSNFGLVV